MCSGQTTKRDAVKKKIVDEDCRALYGSSIDKNFDSIDPMTERQFGVVMRFKCLLILLSLLYATPAVHSWAAAAKVSFDEKAVAEFYKVKTVRIIVGFSAGGGYDAYSRVIGRHLHKHIPGNPTVVVDNMAGAGSILAANHINNVAPKDGTIIGNFSGQIILEQLFANPAVQYDMTKFRILGVPIGETYLLVVTRKPGVSKYEEVIGPKAKQIVMGGIPGSTVEQAPIIVRDALGANIK